ncbi:hypothetical protein EZV73_23600 [Acidaminobacter sp. JC074]|uniref:hypothetical protein n=1 Tax=Acidaminobacter sp. JC074 TaxID=2530199 RepID=UPI001F116584|nr:hypothetical protein [Acidaminobacter sp. JC074]MCH4890587.1 hypothetical protein [Acidaminobacter sp. JC074]
MIEKYMRQIEKILLTILVISAKLELDVLVMFSMLSIFYLAIKYKGKSSFTLKSMLIGGLIIVVILIGVGYLESSLYAST